MTPNEYQKAAMRTAAPKCHDLSNLGLGLAGESGEVADLIKKHLHQGHPLNKEKIAEELGDVAWYLALGYELLDYDLETILQMNVDKLRKRYPDGFDPDRSLHREEQAVTYGMIFNDFKEKFPEYVKHVVDYRPGNQAMTIQIWLDVTNAVTGSDTITYDYNTKRISL